MSLAISIAEVCLAKNLLDLDKLGLENERRVGRDDTPHSAVAIRQVGSDGELALLADLHAEQALVPALDDLAFADGEGERVAAVEAGVELLAIGEGAGVVDLNGVA